MSVYKRVMAEKCRVCHECGQQAVVREGFLEEVQYQLHHEDVTASEQILKGRVDPMSDTP